MPSFGLRLGFESTIKNGPTGMQDHPLITPSLGLPALSKADKQRGDKGRFLWVLKARVSCWESQPNVRVKYLIRKRTVRSCFLLSHVGRGISPTRTFLKSSEKLQGEINSKTPRKKIQRGPWGQIQLWHKLTELHPIMPGPNLTQWWGLFKVLSINLSLLQLQSLPGGGEGRVGSKANAVDFWTPYPLEYKPAEKKRETSIFR